MNRQEVLAYMVEKAEKDYKGYIDPKDLTEIDAEDIIGMVEDGAYFIDDAIYEVFSEIVGMKMLKDEEPQQ